MADSEPRFLQIYFVSDYTEQHNIRHGCFPRLNSLLISELQNMLHQVNQYVQNFKAALESIPQGSNDYKIIISADRRPVDEHRTEIQRTMA